MTTSTLPPLDDPITLDPVQEVDRKAWLGGRPLGALVDHELNPVI